MFKSIAFYDESVHGRAKGPFECSKAFCFAMDPCMCEHLVSTKQMLVSWGLDETLARARIHCKLQHFLTKFVTDDERRRRDELITSELNSFDKIV